MSDLKIEDYLWMVQDAGIRINSTEIVMAWKVNPGDTYSGHKVNLLVSKGYHDEVQAKLNFMIDSAQQNARERDEALKKVSDLERQIYANMPEQL